MSNTIKLKRGSGSDPGSSDLSVGEVALRTDNGKLFTKKDDGSVAQIGGGAGAIDDGAITNAKVASDAAIAGSKIDPDFGSQHITTTGNINGGTNLTLASTVPNIRLNDSDNNPDYRIVNRNGVFNIEDVTHTNAIRFSINTDGHTDINNHLDVGSGLDVTGDITATGTVTSTGLIMGDNKSILLGASDDFRIRHTGSHSEITDEGTGNLRLGSNQVIIGSPTFDETSAKFIDDGAVELYFDNSLKFYTTDDGIESKGELHFKAPASTTGEQVGRLEWWNENDAGVMAKIAVDRTASSNAPADLVFSTSANVDTTANGGDGDITERLRITSAGNVGIGTDPATILHVKANVGDMLRLDRDNSGSVGNQIAFRHKDGSGNFIETCSINAATASNAASGNLRFSTKADGGSNTERMRIKSDGTVDIGGNLDVGAGVDVTGNITATGALDVVGITIGGNTPSLNFTDANDNPDFRFLVNSNSFILEDTTNSANRFVVNSDGHIDIGGNLDVGAGIDCTGEMTSTGSLTLSSDDDGLFTFGGGRFYKKSGTGLMIRLHDANTVGLSDIVFDSAKSFSFPRMSGSGIKTVIPGVP